LPIEIRELDILRRQGSADAGSALKKAEEMLEKAIEALENPKEEDTEKALELFGGTSAAPKLAPKLTALRTHLRDNVSKTHACANESVTAGAEVRRWESISGLAPRPWSRSARPLWMKPTSWFAPTFSFTKRHMAALETTARQ
jgi:hypothetical protein